MEKTKLKEYTARVAQANPSELIVIIYELFFDSLDQGEQAYSEERVEEANAHIEKAKAYLQELMGSLNHKYEISKQLSALYRYVYQQLIMTVVRCKPENFESVREVMGKLKIAFEEVAKKDNSSAVDENARQLYAGLTYGKGSLNEVFMGANEYHGGFKA